ncbi:hypothetical protein EGT07_10145 [Herbaspirillum sp. HC18]|nr:hypothetical protein EGT07_10145 [Herbaspirillum sp. HC18]
MIRINSKLNSPVRGCKSPACKPILLNLALLLPVIHLQGQLDASARLKCNAHIAGRIILAMPGCAFPARDRYL